MAIVEFKDVTRVYTSGDHELKALDGVNFTLDEGKFVVILGPAVRERVRFLIYLAAWTAPQAALSL